MDLFDSLRTFFAAATPIGELRLAIPLGVYVLNMPWYQVLPLALIGNILPVLLLVPGLERIARLLESFPNPAGRMLRWRADSSTCQRPRRFTWNGSGSPALYAPGLLDRYTAVCRMASIPSVALCTASKSAMSP